MKSDFALHLKKASRAGSQEELYHTREAVAAWAQEGREELLYIQGQEG